MVALTHGRPAMISHKVATAVPLPFCTRNPNPPFNDFSRFAFFARSIELYEIMNRTTQTVYSVPIVKRCKKDACPREPIEGNEDIGAIIELDEALCAWEQRVPDHLRLECREPSDDEISNRQAVILRIR